MAWYSEAEYEGRVILPLLFLGLLAADGLRPRGVRPIGEKGGNIWRNHRDILVTSKKGFERVQQWTRFLFVR